jgi:acyl transferase domain-containing protein/2-polyprenyl-3-methyl-5-hydroxy-6-metoxy-1,4-benzoquinol methylase/acyl carrier protein
MKKDHSHSYSGLEIAIIGISGRFPGAKNSGQYWINLQEGKESIAFYSEEELKEAGLNPALLENENYVKAAGVLEDIEYFDAAFFGYTPGEVEMMNPQTRMFYECAYEALEDAGYASDNDNGLIGVYAGGSINYNWEALTLFSGKGEKIEKMAAVTLANKDSLSTRISFKLNLKGPAISLRTACSTSLVAIHLASRALLMKECDIALAGGAAVQNLQKIGYMYRDGLIYSTDGHCRPFDARSTGVIMGDGVGVAALKKLKDALRDRDNIYAVIKGSAINNDGYRKVGYPAPSVEGQSDVILSAQKIAGVEPGSISYIETHGTATHLGDTIEIEALKLAFKTKKKNFCGLGSVKSNIGHLDSAAGVAGFIKTVLALKYKLIPPSLHFETSNPEIDLENSPFYINTKLSEWKSSGNPLRAGVSSFGLGGTNAHVILEEPPGADDGRQTTDHMGQSQGRGGVSPPAQSREYQLILLSAKTETALDQMTKNLAEYFKNSLLNHGNHENPINPGLTLADAAYTLQVGRKTSKYRNMWVCSTLSEAIAALSTPDKARTSPFVGDEETGPVIFMFPGLGSQYVNMGRELYQKEPLFRDEMDRCFEILNGLVDYDLKEILYPPATCNLHLSPDINQIEISQVIVFIFEYALAQLLMKWGIKPQAMIGYSFGEYAAACTAGVFSLEDALKLVVSRGKLLQKIPPGAMLSIPLPVEQVNPFLNTQLSTAIDNGDSCIVAGPGTAIDALALQMKKRKLLCVPVPASHAMHSPMMEPILNDFEEIARGLTLSKLQIPYISNVTGDWINDRQVREPAYWAKHLRQTVQFAAGMKELAKEENALFLEIGPGQELGALALRYMNKNSKQKVINLVRPPQKDISDIYFLMSRIGRLWLYGVKPDWTRFYGAERRFRISLPTYPFERQRYWIDDTPGKTDPRVFPGIPSLNKKRDLFYIPSWKPSPLPIGRGRPGKSAGQSCWVVFMEESGFSAQLLKQLQENGLEVFPVKMGPGFMKANDFTYIINPRDANDYDILLTELYASGKIPGTIVHLWGITGLSHSRMEIDPIDQNGKIGFYSLVYLAQAIGKQRDAAKNTFRIKVVTNNMQRIPGEEILNPWKTTVLSAVKIIPKEYPNITCTSIDINLSEPGTRQAIRTGTQLLVELKRESPQQVMVYRGNDRLVPGYEPVQLKNPGETALRLKDDGVYLVSGGLEGIGFQIAKYITRTSQAKLVFIAKPGLPLKDRENRRLSTGNHAPGEDSRLHPGKLSGGNGFNTNINKEIDFLNEAERKIEKELALKELDSFEGLEQALNRLCSGYILDYFGKNSIRIEQGRIYDREDLKHRLRILPAFDKFYDFFIKVLSENRLIREEGGKIEFLSGAAKVNAPRQWAKEALEKYPGFSGTIRLLEYCTKHYSQALSGEINANEVLFPRGKNIKSENKHLDSVKYGKGHIYVLLIRELVAKVIREAPPGRTIRILEIGAGQGLLTNPLIPVLSNQNVQYHFTDIGNFFVVNAKKEAERRGLSFMKFGTFDIQKSPTEQGYDKNSFDMILSLNVVHMVKVIKDALKNLKQLLAPGGIICLVEITEPKRWIHMINGLAEGWWHFEDSDIRTDSSLLGLPTWEKIFKQLAFQNVYSFPLDERRKLKTDCGLIIAQQERRIQSSDESDQMHHNHRQPAKAVTRNLTRLENLGANTCVMEAGQLRQTITRIEEQFGKINGVIHCIEKSDNKARIQEISPGTIERIFTSGIKGVLELKESLKDASLDFFVLCSSLNSIDAPEGTIESTAANIFFDSLAHYDYSMNGNFTACINWDPHLEKELSSNGTGIMENIFNSILDRALPRLIVTPRDPLNLTGGIAEKSEESVREPEETIIPPASKYRRPELSSLYVEPANDIQRTLVRILEDFLDIEPIGISDDFLELGCDSLIFITIAAKIHRALNVKVPIRAFLTHTTIKELASYIKNIEIEIFSSIEPVEKKDYYPLSSAQERLHLLYQMDPDSTAYNVPMLFRLEGGADRGKLEKYFKKLILRHESLRTSFAILSDLSIQIIHGDADFKMEYYDMEEVEVEVKVEEEQSSVLEGTRGLAPLSKESAASTIKSFIRPFDLSKAPLLRVILIKQQEQKYLLVVDIHHIIADGISIKILMRDFAALQTGKQLSPFRLQYKDYSQWQHQGKDTDPQLQQEAYWLEQFREDKEIPLLDLPTDFVRPSVQSFEGQRVNFEITPAETQQLRAMAAEHGTTLYILLLSILYVLLSRITNQETIVIGAVTAGRRHADLEPIMGMFINTLALINFPKPQMPFKQFLENVSERTLTAFENQDYPFEKLVEKAALNRDTSRNPLFDVMFVYENAKNEKNEIPPLNLESIEYKDRGTTAFDLTMTAYEQEERFYIIFKYCTRLFKKTTIMKFIHYFKKILSTVLNDKNILLGNIEISHEYTELETNVFDDDLGDF